ncbi:MAG: recombinase family protein [Cypionkella sp.]|nr:recombinase family protein [Cypionkella sp.]
MAAWLLGLPQVPLIELSHLSASQKCAYVLADNKHGERTKLTTAIHLARLTGATLVIAKLDRLSCNAAFLLTLRDSGVRFLAVDMPEANDLTVVSWRWSPKRNGRPYPRAPKMLRRWPRPGALSWATRMGLPHSGGRGREDPRCVRRLRPTRTSTRLIWRRWFPIYELVAQSASGQ